MTKRLKSYSQSAIHTQQRQRLLPYRLEAERRPRRSSDIAERRRAVFRKTNSGGFTLVELMAVIFIIGVLASLVVGVAGYAARNSDRSKAIADMEKIKNGLEELRVDLGKYPDEAGDITTLSFRTNVLMLNAVESESTYVDPWGNSYRYAASNKLTYSLWSLGADPNDSNDDLNNWSGSQ